MVTDNPLILIVEDNPTQQKVLNILAENFGYRAVLVSSGEEALNALATCDTFQVVLMDWKMADMDGFQCTARIRKLEQESGRRTPIIAVTARAAAGDHAKCIDAGMDDYLSKPFSAEGFRRMLLKWTYDPARPNLHLLAGRKPGSGKGEFPQDAPD
jgi:CheY-like chemotaxis protein